MKLSSIMAHQESRISAMFQPSSISGKGSRSHARLMRPFPIPIRLPDGLNPVDDQPRPADRPVKSNPTRIPDRNTDSINPFGRDFCEAPQSRADTNFVAAHVGVPCTLRALDHQLSCGHKVSTDQPEACARNCEHPRTSPLGRYHDWKLDDVMLVHRYGGQGCGSPTGIGHAKAFPSCN